MKSKPSRRMRPAPAVQPRLGRGLAWVGAAAVLSASATVLLGQLDELRGIAPEQVVEIYRTHGCRCVFPWARALEAEGFIVRLREVDTLGPTRERLHMPEQLRGCHVAKYLGYFVEGHIGASIFRDLAAHHPDLLGVAAMDPKQSSTSVVNATQVVVFDMQGRRSPWDQARRSEGRS